ncbi:uncharacterized protein LOC125242374 [Leguminivora glycinivorella]|uniref:uncharacterized protein LOC125242374 n=1 Tax=Leguminivora glycinivorella TaxID=1035111 RepID=UPI00200CB3F0|nr:uncharacterized protein LOC125242374 [Leguminivora glycinivorella]
MIKLIQLLFIYFIQYTICTGIEIRIEADDAIKILKTFVMSPVFKSIANDFRKSASDYNNPYHPEDDILSNNGVTPTTEGTTTQSPEDIKLEIDNKNYSGKVSEDELADTLDELNIINNATVPDNEIRHNDTSIMDIADQTNAIPKINESDFKDYQPLKRRFSVLKGTLVPS